MSRFERRSRTLVRETPNSAGSPPGEPRILEKALYEMTYTSVFRRTDTDVSLRRARRRALHVVVSIGV